MVNKLKIILIRFQVKVLYMVKVLSYPKGTVLLHKGERVSRWTFICQGWKMLDDLIK